MHFIGNIKDLRKKSGIYKILCHSNNKFYIGSAIDLLRRFRNHSNMLKHNKHPAKYMQVVYNKYGANDFEFIVLEINIELKNLYEREQYYLDFYKSYESNIGFNTCELAGKPPNLSTERRIKSAVAWKGKSFEVVSPDGVLYTGVGVNEFAKQHNLHPSALHRVINGQSKHAKGWKLPNTQISTSKQIVSPNGEIFDIPYKGVRLFARQHNLCEVMVARILREASLFYKGWFLKKNAHLYQNIYKIIAPDGNIILLNKGELYKKARELGLNGSGLNQIISGRRKTYKGYKCIIDNKDKK